MSRALIPISPTTVSALIGYDHAKRDHYEADCLAGKRFPMPGDHAMWERCRQTYRIREWCELFLRFHVSRCRDRYNPVCRISRYFPPILDIKPADLTRPIILQWFRAIGQHSAMQANAALSLLRTMFTIMEEWGFWHGGNPCRDFRWFPRQSRDRFVTEQEMPRLIQAIDAEPPQVKAFFYLCLFTGCRSIEARTVQWKDLDLEEGLWRKPTTKNGKSHLVPLPPPVVEALNGLPRTKSWVFPSPQHRDASLQKTRWFQHWEGIRTRAGLPDVRIHDLRRTMASWLACSGASLSLLQAALNHSNLQSVSVYARYSTKPLKAALAQQAEAMLRCAGKGQDTAARPQPADWPGM